MSKLFLKLERTQLEQRSYTISFHISTIFLSAEEVACCLEGILIISLTFFTAQKVMFLMNTFIFDTYQLKNVLIFQIIFESVLLHSPDLKTASL